jgi:hypothetical protein
LRYENYALKKWQVLFIPGFSVMGGMRKIQFSLETLSFSNYSFANNHTGNTALGYCF